MTTNIKHSTKKYRLSFPFNGTKIYETNSLKKGIRACYKEYKQLSDISEGVFMVTELNTNLIYKFKVNKKKHITKQNVKQDGGGFNDLLSLFKSSKNIKKISDTSESSKSSKLNDIFVEQKLDNILDNKVTNTPDNKINNKLNGSFDNKVNDTLTNTSDNKINDIFVDQKSDNEKQQLINTINELKQQIKTLEQNNTTIHVDNYNGERSIYDKYPSQNKEIYLPLNTDDDTVVSYHKTNNIEPNKHIIVTSDDVYRANTKKLSLLQNI